MEQNKVYRKLQYALLGTAIGFASLVLIILLLRYLSGILLPLTLVYVFSIVLRRPYRSVRACTKRIFGDSRIFPFLIVSVVSITIVSFSFTVLGSLLQSQITGISAVVKTDASNIYKNITESPIIIAFANSILGTPAGEGLGVLFTPDVVATLWDKIVGLVSKTSGTTFNGVMALITWVVIPTFVYSLVTKPVSAEAIVHFFPFVEIRAQKFLSTVLSRYGAKMERYFTLQLVQVVLQIFVVLILFSLFKVEGALAIAIVIGALNLVPNLGTLFLFLSSFVVAALNYSGPMLSSMVAVLVVSIVVLVLDNLILPLLIEKHSKNVSGWKYVNDIDRTLMTVSIIFWGFVLQGFLGLILAIPITIFVVTVLRSLETSKKWQDRQAEREIA